MTHTQTEPTQPLAVDTRTASMLTSISERKLHELKQAGDIPSFRVGRKVLFRVEALNEWCKLQEQGGGCDEK